MNLPIPWLQQLLVGITTALSASFFTTFLNNKYQRLREDDKWHKEKLFEAHTKCISAAVLSTQLARTRYSSNQEQFSKRTEAIIELLTSLNILLVLSSSEQKNAVLVIRNETEQLLKSGQNNLLNLHPELLEEIRDKLIHLMQSDSKLKELGK